MNVPFAVAGLLALTGASIHGIAGEKLVVTKLRVESLPASPFGGSWFTKLMIRATWHITTIAFVVMGAALMACASGTHRVRHRRGAGVVGERLDDENGGDGHELDHLARTHVALHNDMDAGALVPSAP